MNNDKCDARNRPQMLAINNKAKQAIVFRPRCKQWRCPYCAQVNKRLWTMKAYYGAEFLQDGEGEPLRFITLTSHEKLSARQSWTVWPKAWAKLYMRAKRIQSGASYILVPEQHKDGRLHVHFLATWTMAERWWKDNARECGLGFMAESEQPRSLAHAAWYIGKYISKQLDTNQWPKGFRRVRPSHNWPKMQPAAKPKGWHFVMIDAGNPLSHYTNILQGTYDFRLWWADHKQAWEIIGEYSPD